MHLIHSSALSLLSVPFLALTGLCADPAFPPPQHAGPPLLPQHAVTNRAFTGIPSLAVSSGGRLWATWYAGVTPGEDSNNYVVLSTSGDNGKSWKEVLTVDPDAGGPRRTFDPELWLSPDGKLRWFWADRIGGDPKTDGLWMLVLDDPDSETSAWQPPVCVAHGVMMCKPVALSSGEWAMPLCTWYTEQSSKLVISTDAGKTWSLRGGATIPKEDRTFDEHMFVERKDRSLWLLSRTKFGIAESVSDDGGRTWPEMKPSEIPHPSARFFITRLSSGNLLLVKHGPIGKKTGRSHLTAFISKDDGKSWGGGLLLDERSGVSYPDGQQTADGLIRIIYDFDRTGARNILMATFSEADAAAGKPVTDSVRLRQLVSAGSGGQEKRKLEVNANADGAPLLKTPAGALAAEGVQPQPFALGAKLFSDRDYTLSECPAALEGALFLCVALDGRQKTAQCSQAGTVFFLTPVTARNKDSVAQTLVEQGFTKARLPEVRLFDPSNPANCCTLYQKVCAKGEKITFGKWAVPLFFKQGKIDVKVETVSERDARMQWWREARFGMFVHWGLYSGLAGTWDNKPVATNGGMEWIEQRVKADTDTYAKRAIPLFRPVPGFAKAWAALAKEAGCRYIVFTTKHHEGFALHDSKVSDFDAGSVLNRDLVKEIVDAARAEGLRVGFYHSVIDWHHDQYEYERSKQLPHPLKGKPYPNGTRDHSKYVDYLHAEVAELVSNYGPVDVLWWDYSSQDFQGDEAWRAMDLMAEVRAKQPAIIMNNRLFRSPEAGWKSMGTDGFTGQLDPKYGDFVTPEQHIPATGMPGVDWETCMTLNTTWGYSEHDHAWKSPETLIRNLIDIASKGGNYLLNIGPKGDGCVPPESVLALKAVGAWMKVNHEAIYATNASPFPNLPWGRATTKGNILYLHVFQWPADGVLKVPMKADVSRATLLADPSRSLAVLADGDQTNIVLPAAAPDPIATVLRLDLRSAPVITPASR